MVKTAARHVWDNGISFHAGNHSSVEWIDQSSESCSFMSKLSYVIAKQTINEENASLPPCHPVRWRLESLTTESRANKVGKDLEKQLQFIRRASYRWNLLKLRISA